MLQDDATYKTLLSQAGKLEIVRKPPAADYSRMAGRGRLTTLPSYTAGSGEQWQVDTRSCDLAGLDVMDRLRMYEEIHWRTGSPAQMHAPAVASIAAGRTVGVAPEADLYFIATSHTVSQSNGGFEHNLSPVARAIDRIVEANAGLEKLRAAR